MYGYAHDCRKFRAELAFSKKSYLIKVTGQTSVVLAYLGLFGGIVRKSRCCYALWHRCCGASYAHERARWFYNSDPGVLGMPESRDASGTTGIFGALGAPGMRGSVSLQPGQSTTV